MPGTGGRTSLSGARVARELDGLLAGRGKRLIVSDNGTEFTSMAMLRWNQDHQVEWHYIAGKLMQNGSSRASTLFASLRHARPRPGRLARRLQSCAAPGGLGRLTPAEAAAKAAKQAGLGHAPLLAITKPHGTPP